MYIGERNYNSNIFKLKISQLFHVILQIVCFYYCRTFTQSFLLLLTVRNLRKETIVVVKYQIH